MKIKEIMTADVLTVNEDAPITEVAEIISQNKIHAVPVVDDGGKVLGIITETDFFTKDSANMVYLPSLIDFMKCGKLNCSAEEKETYQAVMQAKARDIMTSKCENVSPEMELEDFIRLIKEKSFNSYMVVNDSGDLVGIITVADAIKLL
jgi:CBS domain-containing protein